MYIFSFNISPFTSSESDKIFKIIGNQLSLKTFRKRLAPGGPKVYKRKMVRNFTQYAGQIVLLPFAVCDEYGQGTGKLSEKGRGTGK